MISSPKNPRIATARSLQRRTARAEQQRFLVEGAQGVQEALAAGVPLLELFLTDLSTPLASRAQGQGIEVVEVSDTVMERLSSTVSPQGVVAVAPFVDVPVASLLGSGAGCIALLSACRDPGNAGTVIRSTLAAGGAGVVFGGSSVDIYNPKTVRSSAGAMFHLPHVRAAKIDEAVAELQAASYEVVAASSDGDEDIYDAPLGERVAFLFGSEAWGLPEEVAALATRRVRVPLHGPAESLNLAAAATLCLYEWRRQREQHDRFPDVIAAAAHDLRSPAAAVRSFASTLLSRELDGETRRMLLEGIAFDADRMGLVIQQLVDAARLATGSLTPLDERGDVAASVEELRSTLEGNPDHPEVRWIGPPTLETTFDRGRFRVALAALVEVQVWFATQGTIDVEGQIDGGMLRVEVRRGGASVDERDLDELFAPRQAGSGGGSKLGPFVARGTARAMGGDAVATIDADGVLVLTLTLPVRS